MNSIKNNQLLYYATILLHLGIVIKDYLSAFPTSLTLVRSHYLPLRAISLTVFWTVTFLLSLLQVTILAHYFSFYLRHCFVLLISIFPFCQVRKNILNTINKLTHPYPSSVLPRQLVRKNRIGGSWLGDGPCTQLRHFILHHYYIIQLLGWQLTLFQHTGICLDASGYVLELTRWSQVFTLDYSVAQLASYFQQSPPISPGLPKTGTNAPLVIC